MRYLLAFCAVLLGISGLVETRLAYANTDLADDFYRQLHSRSFTLHNTSGRAIADLREAEDIVLAQAAQRASSAANRGLQGVGGFLFGERFRFDSSLGWDVTAGFRGHLQFGIPLLPARFENVAVAFQSGLVLWSGHRDEARTDLNFGIVGRFFPASKDRVLGANMFFDVNAESSLARLSIGVDLQVNEWLMAFNGYIPFDSSWQEGKDNAYQERAASGFEFRANYALNNTTQLRASLGGWDNTDVNATGSDFGDFSFGGALGAQWQFHPNFSLAGDYEFLANGLGDNRFILGIRAQYPAPPKAQGNAPVYDLYRLVERESRILYAERKKPVVVIVPTDSRRSLTINGQAVAASDDAEQTITLTDAVEEGETLFFAVELATALTTQEGNLTFNLQTQDDTAEASGERGCAAGKDFASDNTLQDRTIAVGSTSDSLSITICKDTTAESQEIFEVILSNFSLDGASGDPLDAAEKIIVKVKIVDATSTDLMTLTLLRNNRRNVITNPSNKSQTRDEIAKSITVIEGRMKNGKPDPLVRILKITFATALPKALKMRANVGRSASVKDPLDTSETLPAAKIGEPNGGVYVRTANRFRCVPTCTEESALELTVPKKTTEVLWRIHLWAKDDEEDNGRRGFTLNIFFPEASDLKTLEREYGIKLRETDSFFISGDSTPKTVEIKTISGKVGMSVDYVLADPE